METDKLTFVKLLSILVIIGNFLFILWITINGLKEHFQGTIYEKLSYVGLTGLLIVNSILIIRKNRHKN